MEAAGRGERRAGGRVLVIGVGNPYRRDDAAGRIAIRRLRARVPGAVTALEHDGEGAALLETWRGADLVVVIDAVASGAAAGTVHRFDSSTGPLPADFACDSTHAVGLADAVELARALGRLPPRLIIYGIEGRVFDAGDGLSPEVDRAVDEVVGRVLAVVAPAAAGGEHAGA